MFKSYREQSKVNWGREYSEGEAPTRDEVQYGAILRIADAVEKMAQNYAALINERDMLRGMYRSERAAAERLYRSNAGLRGVITRMKRKQQLFP